MVLQCFMTHRSTLLCAKDQYRRQSLHRKTRADRGAPTSCVSLGQDHWILSMVMEAAYQAFRGVQFNFFPRPHDFVPVGQWVCRLTISLVQLLLDIVSGYPNVFETPALLHGRVIVQYVVHVFFPTKKSKLLTRS